MLMIAERTGLNGEINIWQQYLAQHLALELKRVYRAFLPSHFHT